MEKLFEIQKILLDEFENLPFYSRKIFDEMPLTNQINGIVGARGVGKTTFLLKQTLNYGAKKRKALYISADNLFFLNNRLIDLVDYLYKQTDVRFLCIDEIHKYPNWKQELKNISDTYLSFQIVFSGSSMIDLLDGKYDLSRRVILYKLYGFSFREYLEFYHKFSLPVLSFHEVIHDHLKITQEIKIPQILKHFKDYLKLGYYPFFDRFPKERLKFQALENAVHMTIYEDIGTLHSLKTPSLFIIEQLLKFIINSSPGEINASKLAKNLKKDFDSISTYLKYLEQAGLIRFIYPGNSGQAYLRNPIKMFPENTNLIHASFVPITQDDAIGKIRETFVVNQIQNSLIPIYYSNKGDFKIENYIVEIGGKNKNNKQIKDEKNAFILADNILTGTKNTIPLYLLGLLY